jgi:NADH-quinone oxidoreductase subunit L
MTRVFMLTFWGEKRWLDGVHPHESPRVMTVPLILLGAGSLVGGLLYLSHWITGWLEPVTGHAEHAELPMPEGWMMPLVLAVVASGVALAVRQYRDPVAGETPADSSVSWLTRAGRHELYGNAINDALAVRPARHLTRALVYVDGAGLDAFVTGFADRLGDLADVLRKQQNGLVRSYALSMVTGALVVLATLLAVTLA